MNIRKSDDGANVDESTVEGFGEEWAAFDQTELSAAELTRMFESYLGIFPFEEVAGEEGFDLGCGSGRWAELAAARVGKLHCIDASQKALAVTRRRLQHLANVEFHHADAHNIPLPDASQGFGYCLGVLHHIPDPEAAMAACASKLRPGAPFLVYLYYRMEQKPLWFRTLWRGTDVARRLVSRLPFRPRKLVAEAIAASIYLPLARLAKFSEKRGSDVSNFPLSSYRNSSFYTMRTDALDRFGTRLEHRFSRDEIAAMMQRCGFTDVRFSDATPYWVALGRRSR